MIGFNQKNGLLHVDEVPLDFLAQEYGTPLYVYSASKIREKVTRLNTALNKYFDSDALPLLAFACKANSNQAVLSLLAKLEMGCDVVSGGELTRALSAGIPPHKIVYSGVGKSDEELMFAIEQDILQINVESRAELERIIAISSAKQKRARIAFRFNPDVKAHTHDKISTGRREDKFGISREEIEELYPYADKHDCLSVQGIHMHIGSQLTQVGPFKNAYLKLAELVEHLKGMNLQVPCLDIGGGLGIVYKDEQPLDLDEYAKTIHEIIAPLNTALIIEPGRFITGDAGILLSGVSYIKETKARNHVILDAGMNDLIRPTLYDAYHEIKSVNPSNHSEKTYDIVGPVCETGDTFQKNVAMPALKAGDLIAIMCSGAYGAVMASNYNTRPLTAEVMVDGENHALIRQKQTIQDIIDKEIIPDWL